MSDAFGTCQFMNAVAEISRGAQHLSVPPVWQRELLDARNPLRNSASACINHECKKENTGIDLRKDQTGMVQHSFIFSPKQIRAIRKHLPPHLAASCSQFELLTACIWRCRTLALNLDPEEVVQVTCVFSGRGKSFGLSLPLGYYGNAVAFPAAASKAGVLCKNPLGYAVELVKKAKSEMNTVKHTAESAVDLMLIKGRPAVYIEGNYFVSDLTRIGFGEIDFGWGYPEYAGPPRSYPFNCYYIKYRSKTDDDDDGILVPICLPLTAMERFQKELKETIEGSNTCQTLQPVSIKSML